MRWEGEVVVGVPMCVGIYREVCEFLVLSPLPVLSQDPSQLCGCL